MLQTIETSISTQQQSKYHVDTLCFSFYMFLLCHSLSFRISYEQWWPVWPIQPGTFTCPSPGGKGRGKVGTNELLVSETKVRFNNYVHILGTLRCYVLNHNLHYRTRSFSFRFKLMQSLAFHSSDHFQNNKTKKPFVSDIFSPTYQHCFVRSLLSYNFQLEIIQVTVKTCIQEHVD